MIFRLKRWWRRTGAPVATNILVTILRGALAVLGPVLPVMRETAWLFAGAAYRGYIALQCYRILVARLEGLPPLDFAAIWSILVIVGLVARSLRPLVVAGQRPPAREVPPERGRY